MYFIKLVIYIYLFIYLFIIYLLLYMCMYVCICVYVYMYVCRCVMYACMYVCMYVCVYVCMCAWVLCMLLAYMHGMHTLCIRNVYYAHCIHTMLKSVFAPWKLIIRCCIGLSLDSHRIRLLNNPQAVSRQIPPFFIFQIARTLLKELPEFPLTPCFLDMSSSMQI
jgi:hypothetical protein